MQANKPIHERILDCFPSGAYALNALLQLLDVVETREVETAAVECKVEPRLLVNPDFVEKHAGTPEKLLMLVMHELHHVLLGHTRLFPCATKVDNLVFDAVINALLCSMFPEPEHTAFFVDYYRADQFPELLLRPPENGRSTLPDALLQPGREKAAELYRALYSKRGATYQELYEALREEVSEKEARRVPLLGGHGRGGGGTIGGSADGDLEKRAPVLFDAVRTIVEKWPQPPEPITGRSLSDLLHQARIQPVRRRSNRSALRSLFRKIGGRQRGNGIPVVDEVNMEVESPVPQFGRRVTVLTALGMKPFLYPAAVKTKNSRRGGEKVHVYLDVSGSIGDLKGALYGAVLDCRDFVYRRVHLFSTEVADVSLEELRQGVCLSTGGTDINCVAEHMREHKVRRAVLITDGFVGKPGGVHRKTLAEAKLGVALTPGYAARGDLEQVTDYWGELK